MIYPSTTSYTDAELSIRCRYCQSNTLSLAEAWIAAVNIEITGSSGNETYTRKSGPCGCSWKVLP